MQRVTSIMNRALPSAFLVLASTFVSVNAQEQTVGLFLYDSTSFAGYTLFAPMQSTTTYLIDNYGRSVHTWESSHLPGNSAYLLGNGNLLRAADLSGGGSGGVQEIAWDGTVLWEFEYYGDDYRQHHDIEPLPNGNVLMLAWEAKTDVQAIAAGRDPALLWGNTLRTEHVVEVEPTGPTSGKIVWEWHVWDHLIQDYDPSKDNYGTVADHPELLDINFVGDAGVDWIHANAIAYNPELDEIVMSSRKLGEIWVVDHSTTTEEAAGHAGGSSAMGGDILYRWGNPQGYDAGSADDQKFFAEHDAHWIETGLPGEGDILVFNNGVGRPDGNYSSVDQIAPPVDDNGHYPQPPPGTAHGPAEQVWIYTADPATDFFARKTSGAQRLANGNTLICSGPEGTFLEVTPEGQTVWKYINPVAGEGAVEQGDPPGTNGTFRCYRYAPNYPGLEGRDLTPGGPIEIYPVSISGTSHFPEAPSTADSVAVTATITDESGINVAELYADTGNGFMAMTMFDDGNHHDGQAGDHLYGAAISPLPESTTVSYYIYAEDGLGSIGHDPPNAPNITYGYVVGPGAPTIYVNEFMANNNDLIQDEAGDFDDWLELYNPGEEPVNLGGMYLTDDLADPTRWQIPDTVIGPGGFLLFWADDEEGEGPLHTNFELGESGEAIGLSAADVLGNAAVDSVTFGPQYPDTSSGRCPNGADQWRFFCWDDASPGEANFVRGDPNRDCTVNVGDVVYTVSYLYKGGPAPDPIEAGDSNCDQIVNVGDVVYLVSYLYKGGPPPGCP